MESGATISQLASLLKSKEEDVNKLLVSLFLTLDGIEKDYQKSDIIGMSEKVEKGLASFKILSRLTKLIQEKAMKQA